MVGVSKAFSPQKKVLNNIYLSFFYGAKIGIIGLNGSGKSTLLKIIAGVEKTFDGEVVFSPGYSVGYLEQEPHLDPTKTVKEIVQEGVQEIVDMLAEYERINEQFAEPDADFDKLIARQGELQELLDHADAWNLDNKLERAMDALRCPDEVNDAAWLCAGCCFVSLTFCYSMNLQTTWTQNQWNGWNTTCNNMPELLLPLPTTDIFWIMFQAGFLNSTEAKEFPGKEIILRGWNRRQREWLARRNKPANVAKHLSES